MSPNLDLLRTVAVMCVFFAHLHDIYTRNHTDVSWHFGQMGVLMFFVHTSLVLMQSLERSELSGKTLFLQFYKSRFFRLYPLAIVCVLLSYAFASTPWSMLELISNLTLTQNLTYSKSMVGGLWTLPLEVQMYATLPFLFIWFKERPVSWLIALWILCIPFAIAQPLISGRLSIVEYMPCFLGGVIAWRMKGLKRYSGLLWPLALTATATIWMISTRENNMYFRWAFCLALGLTIPWFREMPMKRINAAASAIAKYSYGIYLSHIAAMTFAFVTLKDYAPSIQWMAFISLAITMPLMAYHLIEYPMIQLGKAAFVRPVHLAKSGSP